MTSTVLFHKHEIFAKRFPLNLFHPVWRKTKKKLFLLPTYFIVTHNILTLWNAFFLEFLLISIFMNQFFSANFRSIDICLIPVFKSLSRHLKISKSRRSLRTLTIVDHNQIIFPVSWLPLWNVEMRSLASKWECSRVVGAHSKRFEDGNY